MSRVPLGTACWIYVLQSPTLAIPDSHGMPTFLYKVGMTTLHPVERARQLTAATAAAAPFAVVHYRWAMDGPAAEARCHELLDAHRVNDNREYFTASLSDIIRVVDEVTGHAHQATEREYPWATLFASFDQDGPPELTVDERRKCRKLAMRLELEQELAREEREAA